MDYYDDQELAVFHEIIARETCIRNCRDKEVRVICKCNGTPLARTSNLFKLFSGHSSCMQSEIRTPHSSVPLGSRLEIF